MFKSTTMIQPTTPPKDPILTVVLSLILAGGAGQIYLGQVKKGILLIVGTVVGMPLCGVGIIIYAIGVIDAYRIAKKLQGGQPVGDMEFFWESSG